eukprot:181778_1
MIKIYLYLNPSFTFIDIMIKYTNNSINKHLEICQYLMKELKYFKPQYDPSVLSIGCLLLMASNNENAIDKAHKALNSICKKNPKHILSHLAFGCSLYLKKLPNKAIQFFNKFISENPKYDNKNFDDYQQLLLIISQLKLNELSNIFANDRFKTSNIPYQELYEHDDNYLQNMDKDENMITFDEFTDIYFTKLQSANLEVMCKELKNKKNKNDIDISYIFDNNIYWKNNEFNTRFNVSDLIPKYIYNLMQSMIDDYNEKNKHIPQDEKIEFELNEIIDSIIMLKQIAIGGIFTGAQPHFHGPVFNGLIKGQKQWIIFPPNKSFQMKQTAIQFFCYHDGLSKEKKQKLTYYTFTQNVGDVVFIPHEWTHAVLNVQPSIAVAVELFI